MTYRLYRRSSQEHITPIERIPELGAPKGLRGSPASQDTGQPGWAKGRFVTPHWYYIPRYPLGLDATVSGSQSMRFSNDTKHPVLIKAFASPGMVRFEIWSVPNGRTASWSRPSVSNVVAGHDTVQDTSSLPRGKRERIEWPVDGKDVRRPGGPQCRWAVIHGDAFVSRYHRMVVITRVGT